MYIRLKLFVGTIESLERKEVKPFIVFFTREYIIYIDISLKKSFTVLFYILSMLTFIQKILLYESCRVLYLNRSDESWYMDICVVFVP